MERDITTPDVAEVSDAQLADALQGLSHYRLLEIVRNFFKSNSKSRDALKGILFAKENRVSRIDKPPGPTFYDHNDDSFDDTNKGYDIDEIEEKKASVDEKKRPCTKKVSRNKGNFQANGEGSGESALEIVENPDGRRKSKVGISCQATGTRRPRKRYATCFKCKIKFDVRKNNNMGCRYHPKKLVYGSIKGRFGPNFGYCVPGKRYEYDNNDREGDRENRPGWVKIHSDLGYYYDCCKRVGSNAKGCTVGWHREEK